MPSKPPVVFPQEQRLLSQLGERLRLARLRRKLSNAVVAQRAGISRTSLYKVEAGDPGATLGTYLRVMAVLGLEADFNALAAAHAESSRASCLLRLRTAGPRTPS
jgi:transcriptional regulator with XRE-family HTH domain